MENQTGNQIKDLLQKLTSLSNSIVEPHHSFEPLLECAAELIYLYNEKELAGQSLSQEDYEAFLLTQFILNDTTNARYLWKRIPKSLKEAPEGAAPSSN